MGMEKVICEAAAVNSAIETIADAIIKDFCSNDKIEEFALVGLFKQGVPLSCRLAKIIGQKCNIKVPLAALDISMYRDDIGMRKTLPLSRETVVNFDIDGKVVILADDVMQAGRSIRAALDAITDFGRPAIIRLAILVDSNEHDFPISADYTGQIFQWDKSDEIKVRWNEIDSCDRIELQKKISFYDK